MPGSSGSREEGTSAEPSSAEGEVSQGPNAFPDAETSAGGADAVPDTPDKNADPDSL